MKKIQMFPPHFVVVIALFLFNSCTQTVPTEESDWIKKSIYDLANTDGAVGFLLTIPNQDPRDMVSTSIVISKGDHSDILSIEAPQWALQWNSLEGGSGTLILIDNEQTGQSVHYDIETLVFAKDRVFHVTFKNGGTLKVGAS